MVGRFSKGLGNADENTESQMKLYFTYEFCSNLDVFGMSIGSKSIFSRRCKDKI